MISQSFGGTKRQRCFNSLLSSENQQANWDCEAFISLPSIRVLTDIRWRVQILTLRKVLLSPLYFDVLEAFILKRMRSLKLLYMLVVFNWRLLFPLTVNQRLLIRGSLLLVDFNCLVRLYRKRATFIFFWRTIVILRPVSVKDRWICTHFLSFCGVVLLVREVIHTCCK